MNVKIKNNKLSKTLDHVYATITPIPAHGTSIMEICNPDKVLVKIVWKNGPIKVEKYMDEEIEVVINDKQYRF